MAAHYEIWLTNDKGLRIAPIVPREFTATMTANKIGKLYMQTVSTIPREYLKRDNMVQIWRAPAGGRLSLWRVYLLRWWKINRLDTGRLVELRGWDTNELLRRRIVAHYSISSEAWKTDNADDMMKEVVTESIADGSNPAPEAGTRVWGDLSVAGDVSAAPSVTLKFAWRKLLMKSGTGALAQIAAKSREEGTELYFDVRPDTITPTSITFKFHTFVNQIGADRTAITLSENSLKNPSLEYDARDEENYIYVGGRGLEDNLEMDQVYDADLYNASHWGRIEKFITAQDDDLEARGMEMLEQGRPWQRFVGWIADVEGSRYAVNWKFGDRMTVSFEGQQFEPMVSSVVISYENGKEQVVTRLDYKE